MSKQAIFGVERDKFGFFLSAVRVVSLQLLPTQGLQEVFGWQVV